MSGNLQKLPQPAVSKKSVALSVMTGCVTINQLQYQKRVFMTLIRFSEERGCSELHAYLTECVKKNKKHQLKQFLYIKTAVEI